VLKLLRKREKKESNIKEENDKDSNDNIISSKNSIIKKNYFAKFAMKNIYGLMIMISLIKKIIYQN